MKKLISLLSVLTISATSAPTLIATKKYEKKETINKTNTNYQQTNKLENLNRIKRSNNIDYTEIYWINSETNFRKETDVPYSVTTMYTFTSDGGNRKAGDIYFGTTNGVYLRKAGESTTTKINGINDPIVSIQWYPNNINYRNNFCSVHIITNKGEIYYIRGGDNAVFKQTVPYPVTTMYTFNSDWGNRKTGDIYFGTTNGLYLRQSGATTATKIDGINDPIVSIQWYPNNINYPNNFCNMHIITNKGEIYYIRGGDNAVFKQSIPYPVTTMYTFNYDGGNRKIGDIYFGTTNGLYLRKAGATTATKINGINDPVTLIQPYINKGSVHIINLKGEIYYVNENSNVFKQSIPYPVTTMYTFTKDGGSRKTGDIYFGTTNGLYLRKAGESTTTKINGINDPIVFIKKYPDNNNSVHIIKLIVNKNILERRDNNNNNNNLNIIPIVQEEDYWCGPAIAEAILRYYGLESLNESSRQTHYQFQRTLSQQMHTINGGTLMNDWISGMNNIILSNRLNYSRTYSRTDFDLAYNDTNTSNRFYNIVSYSLQYNVPVAFMYHGSRRLNEEDHSHFILITGIRNNYSNVIYTFLDPWTGTRGEFNSSNLNSFLTPTRMYDNEERPTSYGGQLAAFTGSITNWDYKTTHIHFNENTDGNSCAYSDLSSFTNISQAVAVTGLGVAAGEAFAATGLGAAAGSEFPIVGNIAGGIIGFISWYYLWLEKCNK